MIVSLFSPFPRLYRIAAILTRPAASTLAGVAIYFVLDLLSRFLLRNWHKSAIEEKA